MYIYIYIDFIILYYILDKVFKLKLNNLFPKFPGKFLEIRKKILNNFFIMEKCII